MRQPYRGRSGFAVAVVLLVSMVALVAAVSTASIAAVSARRVANIEQRSTVALFAAESGLNTIIARSEVSTFDGYSDVASWLSGSGLEQYTLPSGATVDLSVSPVSADVVTIRSQGTAPDQSSVRVVFQDFDVRFGEVRPSLFANAALVTKTALKTSSRFSRLVGLDADEASWTFDATLAQARLGDYVVLENERYRLTDITSGTYTLSPLRTGVAPRYEEASEPVELIPFAVGRPIDAPGANPPPYTAAPSSLYVTNGEIFLPGEEIRVQRSGSTVDNIGIVGPNGWNPDTGLLDVQWPGGWLGEVAEGTPVRKVVLSAIAEDGCPADKTFTDDKLPQGCEDRDDGVDLGDLWLATFGGISKTDLRAIAMGDETVLAKYPDYDGVPTAHYQGGAWPSAVTGLTWIDGAQTQGKNNQLCGSGIVVLNTGASLDDDPDARINLTTADCDFSGILYVVGQLKLVGNLDNFSGAIFVEGPGGITEAEGTGDKSLYDPIAIREALDLLPRVLVFEGLFQARPSTWRLAQR